MENISFPLCGPLAKRQLIKLKRMNDEALAGILRSIGFQQEAAINKMELRLKREMEVQWDRLTDRTSSLERRVSRSAAGRPGLVTRGEVANQRVPAVSEKAGPAFAPDWQKTCEKIASEPWAAAIADEIEKEALFAKDLLTIPPPDQLTAWSHYYFCDESGEELFWNPIQPAEHVCRSSGKIYHGEPYDGCWRTRMHSANAIHLENCAVLWRIGRQPEMARQEIERIAEIYAETYPGYHVHGHSSQKGRLQPQSLDESVWTITFLRALRWSGLIPEMTGSRKAALAAFAQCVIDLLRPQIIRIDNIQCWLNAAVAECAVLLGDSALLKWCIENPAGMRAQIEHGFDSDGFWHEGSVHYHLYTLAAILAFAEASGEKAFATRQQTKLHSAFAIIPALAYSDGFLPAYNDGWPRLHLAGIADTFEAATAVLPKAVPADLLAAVYRHEQSAPYQSYSHARGRISHPGAGSIQTRFSLAALVFGPAKLVEPLPEKKTSQLFAYAGIGILRNETTRLGLRFGPGGKAHDHLDKLDVDVETAKGWRSLDLGTSGYGSKLFKSWQKTSASHNILVIDGRRQLESTGHVLEWSESAVTAEAREAYPGVALRRRLSLEADGWSDHFLMTASSPRRIDWIFHGDGAFAPEGLEGEEFTFAEENGYQCIFNVRRAPAPELLNGRWQDEGIRQEVQIQLPPGFEIYWGEAEGNPHGRPLGVVILRGVAQEASFLAKFLS